MGPSSSSTAHGGRNLPSANAHPATYRPGEAELPERSEHFEIHQSVWAGPIPQPEDLAGYKDIDPQLPARIVAMAEKEQVHRHDMDRKCLGHIAGSDSFGQVGSILVALACVTAAAYMAQESGGYALAIAVLGIGQAAAGGILKRLDKSKTDSNRKPE